MRVKNEELSDAILEVSLNILLHQPGDKFNIRAVAKEVGVSVGTVYNYFESKDAILLKLTENYWKQQLFHMNETLQSETIIGRVEEVYSMLYEGIQGTGGILMRSLSDGDAIASGKMMSMQDSLRIALIHRMKQDTKIRDDVWNETFTIDDFSVFVISNILGALRSNQSNIQFLIEIMRRILY